MPDFLVSEMANQNFPWWLCAACNEKQDSLAAKKASVARAGSKSPELRKIVSEVADKIASYPQTQLDETISARLKPAQLVVWNYHGKPTLAIFCVSNAIALFAKLVLSRVSGKGLAVCPQMGNSIRDKAPEPRLLFDTTSRGSPSGSMAGEEDF